MKKTIGKIATGIALVTALAAPTIAQAQEKPAATVQMENGTRFNDNENGVYFQRFRVEHDIANVCYDLKTNLKDKNKEEADMLEVYKTFNLNDSTIIGPSYFRTGDWKNTDDHVLDLFVKTQNNGNTYMLDAGMAFNKTTKPWNYVYGTFTGSNINLEACALGVSHTLGTEGRNKFFGLAGAWTDDQFFAAAGVEDRNQRYFAGKISEDYGSLSFAKINQDDTWSFKSQHAFGDISKGFFNMPNFVWASSILTVPRFEFIKLGGFTTKGDNVTAKLEGFGDKSKTNLSAMIGYQTPIGAFGAGPQFERNKGEEKFGAAFEYTNKFSLLGIKGSVEGTYSTVTEQAEGYLKVAKDF